MKSKATLFSIFGFSFFLLLLFFKGRFEGYEKETFFAARALIFGGEINARIGALGVLLSLPFALLYEAANRLGWETLRDFFGPLSVVFYTALIPVVFYSVNKMLFENRRIAVTQSLILLIGTMIFPYSNIGVEHTAALLMLISYGFLVGYHKKGNRKFLIFSAVALSCATLIKPYSILFAIPLALYLLISDRIVKDKKAVMIALAALSLGVAAHFLWNYAIFGNFFSGRYRLSWELQYDSILAGFYGLLFSAGKSMFLFNPVLILAIPGFAAFWKKERPLAAATLAGIFIFILFHAPFRFWTDEIWGPRKLLMIVPLVLVPAGYLWSKFAHRHVWIKITTFGIVITSVFVQLLGVLYRTGKYLFFLREMKLDALQFMQYVPALSQINVHWFFLKAYVSHLFGATIPVFNYTIHSWMRALFPSGRDIVLIGGTAAPKEIFYTPDIWYLSRQIPYSWVSTEYKIIYLVVVAIGIMISGKMLYGRMR